MHWFDITILVIIAFALIAGFASGLIKQVASLAGVVAGVLLTKQLSTYIAPWLTHIPHLDSYYVVPLAYLLTFILIYTLIMLVGNAIHGMIKIIQLGMVNRLAGSVLSCAKWLILMSIALNFVAAMDKDKTILKEDIREKTRAYPLLKNIAPKAIPCLRFDYFTYFTS